MIKAVTKIEVIKFTDSGQRKAFVSWVDHRGDSGRTEGAPTNAHMKALIARGRREKVRVERSTW